MRSNFTPNTIKFDILCLPRCWRLYDYCDSLNVEFSCGWESVVQIFQSICSAYFIYSNILFFPQYFYFKILWRGPFARELFIGAKSGHDKSQRVSNYLSTILETNTLGTQTWTSYKSIRPKKIDQHIAFLQSNRTPLFN